MYANFGSVNGDADVAETIKNKERKLARARCVGLHARVRHGNHLEHCSMVYAALLLASYLMLNETHGRPLVLVRVKLQKTFFSETLSP